MLLAKKITIKKLEYIESAIELRQTMLNPLSRSINVILVIDICRGTGSESNGISMSGTVPINRRQYRGGGEDTSCTSSAIPLGFSIIVGERPTPPSNRKRKKLNKNKLKKKKWREQTENESGADAGRVRSPRSPEFRETARRLTKSPRRPSVWTWTWKWIPQRDVMPPPPPPPRRGALAPRPSHEQIFAALALLLWKLVHAYTRSYTRDTRDFRIRSLPRPCQTCRAIKKY